MLVKLITFAPERHPKHFEHYHFRTPRRPKSAAAAEVVKTGRFTTCAAAAAEVAKTGRFTTSATAAAEVVKTGRFTTSARKAGEAAGVVKTGRVTTSARKTGEAYESKSFDNLRLGKC